MPDHLTPRDDLAAVATAANDSVSNVSDPTAVRGDTPVNPPKEIVDDLSGFDADAFVEEPDEIVQVEAPEEPAAPPAPVTPTPAEPAKSEPVAPAAAAPATPAPPVEPTPSAQPTTQAATPPESPQELTPEKQQEAYKQWFDGSVEQLTSVYALTPEVAEELDREPSKVFPKLAAHMHMQMIVGAATVAANLFQTMLPEYQARQAEERAYEDTFYNKYKALKDHKAEVDNIARAVRMANPNLRDSQQFMDTVGTMAHVQLRIPLPADMQPPVVNIVPAAITPTAAVAAPAAPATPQAQASWLEELTQED